MTKDEIVRAMAAIADKGDAMTAEDVAAYEGHEAELQRMVAAEQVVARQAAWKSVHVAAPVATGGVVERSGEDEGFAHYLRTGKPNGDLQRAQSEGTASAGGYLVPEGFRAVMVERMKAFGGLQAVSDSVSTGSGNPLPWPTNDDVSNLGAIVAEGASLPSGADLVIGTRTLGAYTYTSNGTGNAALKVSYDLLQDSTVDIPGFVGRKLGERIARKVAVDYVNGTGAGQPTGILSTAGGLTGATALSSNSAPTYADLLAIVHDLDPAYRANARWLFNDKFLKLVRGIVDENGRPLLWDYSMQLGQNPGGMSLLGYPVVIDQACPDPSASNAFGVFGDINSAFVIRNVRDIGLVTLAEKYAEERQVGYMAWMRTDSNVQDVNAAVLLKAHS